MPSFIGRNSEMGKTKGKLFDDYPDVVNITQMCAVLGGIGKKTAYELLKSGSIRYVKIGKSFKIPKVFLVEYLIGPG